MEALFGREKSLQSANETSGAGRSAQAVSIFHRSLFSFFFFMLDCGQNKNQNALFHDLPSLNIVRVDVVCSLGISVVGFDDFCEVIWSTQGPVWLL